MSMFSGLTNQISGFIAKGKGEAPPEGEVIPQQENGEEVMAAVEGEEGAAAQGSGGVSGLAQGLMMKAMNAKDGFKEKASTFQPPNLQGLGNNLMQNVSNFIPGRREEEVPTPPEPNPPTDMGGEVMEGEEQVME
ncbi:hypothetical protein TCAL_14368 [Tigriopus californicus]|uniref:Uncharacterized protein n=1 Tax=Tigriopus californicus TaxID=6832 RepID=A0A553NFX5_TIGCA|nr:uncharacterized protein LOC131888310 [Tigriopus californicus]TRY64305.1 hypothetical protein TCAL_14368 [Tigriopus californicus]